MSLLHQNFISRYRLAIYNYMAARDTLDSLKREYDAGGLSASLDQTLDFTGDNAEILKADFVAAVGSVAAIESFIAIGFHDTNLFKVKRTQSL